MPCPAATRLTGARHRLCVLVPIENGKQIARQLSSLCAALNGQRTSDAAGALENLIQNVVTTTYHYCTLVYYPSMNRILLPVVPRLVQPSMALPDKSVCLCNRIRPHKKLRTQGLVAAAISCRQHEPGPRAQHGPVNFDDGLQVFSEVEMLEILKQVFLRYPAREAPHHHAGTAIRDTRVGSISR